MGGCERGWWQGGGGGGTAVVLLANGHAPYPGIRQPRGITTLPRPHLGRAAHCPCHPPGLAARLWDRRGRVQAQWVLPSRPPGLHAAAMCNALQELGWGVGGGGGSGECRCGAAALHPALSACHASSPQQRSHPTRRGPLGPARARELCRVSLTKEWQRGAAGLEGPGVGQGGDEHGARLGLPPGVQDGAAALAHHLHRHGGGGEQPQGRMGR